MAASAFECATDRFFRTSAIAQLGHGTGFAVNRKPNRLPAVLA